MVLVLRALALEYNLPGPGVEFEGRLQCDGRQTVTSSPGLRRDVYPGSDVLDGSVNRFTRAPA